MRRAFKRLITRPLLLLAALFLIVEETLFQLARVLAWLGKLPVFRGLEAFLAGLPPYAALVVFAVPSVALAPVKMLALYWLAGGHPALGITTIITAKLIGTACVARLFQLTKPKLLTIGWFAWAFEKLMVLRAAAYGLILESAAGRWIRKHWQRMRERWRAAKAGWLKSRWRAAVAKLRR
jgi:hypothetical protein